MNKLNKTQNKIKNEIIDIKTRTLPDSMEETIALVFLIESKLFKTRQSTLEEVEKEMAHSIFSGEQYGFLKTWKNKHLKLDDKRQVEWGVLRRAINKLK